MGRYLLENIKIHNILSSYIGYVRWWRRVEDNELYASYSTTGEANVREMDLTERMWSGIGRRDTRQKKKKKIPIRRRQTQFNTLDETRTDQISDSSQSVRRNLRTSNGKQLHYTVTLHRHRISSLKMLSNNSVRTFNYHLKENVTARSTSMFFIRLIPRGKIVFFFFFLVMYKLKICINNDKNIVNIIWK